MRGLALFALATATAITAASPALAVSEDLLECPGQGVTPAFRDKLADAVLAAESPETDAMFAQLLTVAEACAERHGLTKGQGEAYFTYALSRLLRDASSIRLGDAGISVAVLDEALDFGPGRTNPAITGDLEPAQIERIVAALAANGVAVDTVPQSSWELVGGYAAATSQMWQARTKLP